MASNVDILVALLDAEFPEESGQQSQVPDTLQQKPEVKITPKLNYDVDIFGGPESPQTEPKNIQPESSAVHTYLTDSSDDEDNKYFETTKYNSFGKDINKQLKDAELNKTDKLYAMLAEASNKKGKPKEVENRKSNQLALPEMPVSKRIDVYADPIFGIRLINPLISSRGLSLRMEGKAAVKLNNIKSYLAVNSPESGDYVIAGAIVRSVTKQSHTGSQYIIWEISDLKDDLISVPIFLFGASYNALWKTTVGTVVGILNPKQGKKEGDSFSLTIYNADQVMIWGTSKDYGRCKAIKKNGEKCSSFVNKSVCEFCLYHIKKEYTKFSSNRSELQSPTGGHMRNVNLRNKVLGKNEVFYGGRSFMSVKPPSVKTNKKDQSRLTNLGVTVFEKGIPRASTPVFNQMTRGREVMNRLSALGGPLKTVTLPPASSPKSNAGKPTASRNVDKPASVPPSLPEPKNHKLTNPEKSISSFEEAISFDFVNTKVKSASPHYKSSSLASSSTIKDKPGNIVENTEKSVHKLEIGRKLSNSPSLSDPGKHKATTVGKEKSSANGDFPLSSSERFVLSNPKSKTPCDLPKHSLDSSKLSAKSSNILAVSSRQSSSEKTKSEHIVLSDPSKSLSPSNLKSPGSLENKKLKQKVASSAKNQTDSEQSLPEVSSDLNKIVSLSNLDTPEILKCKQLKPAVLSDPTKTIALSDPKTPKTTSKKKKKKSESAALPPAKSRFDSLVKMECPKQKKLQVDSNTELHRETNKTPNSGNPKTSTDGGSFVKNELVNPTSSLVTSQTSKVNVTSSDLNSSVSSPAINLVAKTSHLEELKSPNVQIPSAHTNPEKTPILDKRFTLECLINRKLPPSPPVQKMSNAKRRAIDIIKAQGLIPQPVTPRAKLLKEVASSKRKRSEENEKPVFSELFMELMKKGTQNMELVEMELMRKEEEYFEKMGLKEALEQKMLNTFKVDCKAVRCLKCKYTWFSSSDVCKSEGHPLKVVDAVKRFFKCNDCGNRTVALTVIPLINCKQCQGSNWTRAAMIREKIVKNNEGLSIRGGEQNSLNSVVTNANLNLLVPE